MQKLQKKYLLFLLTSTLFLSMNVSVFSQLEIPPKPNLQTSFYDGAKLLSGYEKNALEQKLINYNDTTSTQIVVATINNLNGEDIALYATKWAHEWGVGQAEEDNGVFVLVAKDDRKLWIATGYGVEHLLTDALSKRIINNIITPQFKQGDFYSGLDKGTSAIIQILNGEYQGTPQHSSDGGDGIPFIFIILFLIILLIILSNRNKRNRGNRGNRRDDTARSILEAIILSRAGRGGFGGGGGFGGSSGGGSFGGGGFGGGFGGGGFGGGGAGGSW
ncbi:TPM domain-containing protein [Aureibaculum sp. 2210JD6-5]|uniref:TPM domain-containing protein n=1 Tax=Aureibaculum sp. 2210JD6-5 TaxID=3103957 RepID=UPI002AADB92D|nr:TPM domain-containing protein [Aureibaculum sp. 2210JD6-5]MDY7394861.1 TPM domain-containing protein [Aureibaculum sp. 2210JD6-5]